MRITFSRLAEADLEEIGDYIARDNPARALSFIHELRAHCRAIAASPLSYPQRPELHKQLRACAHGSYIIFFKVADDRVFVVRVLHTARDLINLLGGS
jgi:toxin ParE1/3/4